MFFRPKNKEINIDEVTFDHTEEDDIIFHVPHTFEKENKTTLLWLHQSRIQLHILRRYVPLLFSPNFFIDKQYSHE